MNILFLCGREVSYPLNQILIRSLQQIGNVEVIDANGSGKSILKRSIKVFFQAFPRLLAQPYDLVFIGFYGQFLAPAVRPFTKAPIVFHPLISTYETLVFDRKKVAQNSIPAKLAYTLDTAACRAADHILLDTENNAAYISKLLDIPREKFSTIFVGSDEHAFYPRPARQTGSRHLVIYQGSFLPLHGVDVIIQAAKLLDEHKNIRFRLFGDGPERKRIDQMIESLCISNIEFHPAISQKEMAEQLAEASVCLGGHFGPSEKAARVIAGKTFQDIAMGKATIVGENAANHELLTHRFDSWFCPMNDPHALAEAVLTLVENADLREKIGQNARQTFLQHASLQALAPKIGQVVNQVILKKNGDCR